LKRFKFTFMPSNLKILAPTGIILIFSLTVIWSTAPNLFIYQASFIALGFLLLFSVRRIDLYAIRQFSFFLYILGITLLLLTLLLGDQIRGTTRWLYIGPLSLQTSELIKPFLVLYWADFIIHNPLDKIFNLFKYLILVIIPTFLVFIQPDLGSSVMIVALGIGIALLAGLKMRYLFIGFAGLSVFFFLIFPHLHQYQKDRINTFLNPYIDPQGLGYNTIQSTIAIGSGQLLGRGVRQGIQSQLKFLPERHADFAFASFAEEFGLIGSTFLFFSYAYLLLQFYKTAVTQKNDFSYYVISSVLFIFCLQMLINISVNLGLLPVTGIPLPLFSYGGSSVVSHLILIGFICHNLKHFW